MRAPGIPARLAAGCGLGVLLLTACSSGGSTAAPTRTVTVTVTPSAPATSRAPVSASPMPSGALPCLTTDVHLTTGTSNGAAGTIYYPLEFTNASSSACTMYGYPGVAFVSSPQGSQVGAPAGRQHESARTVVTVAAGATVHATLAVSDVLISNNCHRHQVQVNWVQVYPPGAFSALYAPLNRMACAEPGLVTMTVTAVSSGP